FVAFSITITITSIYLLSFPTRRSSDLAPADRLDDVADDCHQLLFGLEPDRRHQDLAVDLDVDIVRAHDHDLGYEGVLHELGERTQTRVVVIAHWINLTADGNVLSVGSAMIETPPFPLTVAVHEITPPAIVAR